MFMVENNVCNLDTIDLKRMINLIKFIIKVQTHSYTMHVVMN